mmetsp:Transcript_22381/g.67556  ORF Transcript_22381/g.67556 Transcript_22381/m.67556 type:complete len:226 (+) Transcript_22381:988-1665(+)
MASATPAPRCKTPSVPSAISPATAIPFFKAEPVFLVRPSTVPVTSFQPHRPITGSSFVTVPSSREPNSAPLLFNPTLSTISACPFNLRVLPPFTCLLASGEWRFAAAVPCAVNAAWLSPPLTEDRASSTKSGSVRSLTSTSPLRASAVAASTTRAQRPKRSEASPAMRLLPSANGPPLPIERAQCHSPLSGSSSLMLRSQCPNITNATGPWHAHARSWKICAFPM